MRSENGSTDQYPGRPDSDGDAGRSFIERARRRQILEAAVAVIAQEGFAQASLARIAARAGISKGVISYHFAGKAELIHQVVVSVYTEGAERVGPAVEATATARDALAGYVRENLAFLADNPEKVRALIEIFTSFRADDDKLPFDATSDEPIIAPLVGICRRGQDAGEFGAFDPTVMARTVRAAVDAVPPQMAAYPDLDVAAYAEELVALFDRATRRDAPEETP